MQLLSHNHQNYEYLIPIFSEAFKITLTKFEKHINFYFILSLFNKFNVLIYNLFNHFKIDIF